MGCWSALLWYERKQGRFLCLISGKALIYETLTKTWTSLQRTVEANCPGLCRMQLMHPPYKCRCSELLPCKTLPLWLGMSELCSPTALWWPRAAARCHPTRSATKSSARKSPSSSLCVCLSVFVCPHTKEVTFSFVSEILHCSSYTVPSAFSLRVVKFRWKTLSVFSTVNHRGFKFTSLYLQTSNFCMHRIQFHLKTSPPKCLTLEHIQKKRKLNSRPQAKNLTLAPLYPVYH